MKFLSVIIFIFLIIPKNNYGQELDRCWPLGTTDNTLIRRQSNLVFVGNALRIDTVYRDVKFSGTCSSISDSAGNMLFYTNGCVVANSNNDTMVNGNDLNPGQCQASTCPYFGNAVTQGSIILPDPSNSNKYLIFHESCDYGASYRPIYIYQSIVDLSLDSGRGEVTLKNYILLSDTVCVSSLTAVKHANGMDWWLVTHEKFQDRFIKFLINSNGISGPFYQSIGTVYDDDGHGTSEFSPDGNWYATSTQFGGIDVYKFNRCNGELSERNFIDLPDSQWTNSLEFSPDSRFLYSAWLHDIYQFDLTSTNIASSGTIVAVYDGFLDDNDVSHPTEFCWPQLAPDGKIYIGTGTGTTYMHIIDQPNNLGIACNVIQHGIRFPSLSVQVPNFPNYRLGPLDSLYCDTVNSVNEFEYRNNNISVFPNPSTGIFNIQNKDSNEIVLYVSAFDYLGKELICKLDDNSTFDLGSLNNGLYILKIATGRGNYFRQILINK